ncbi:hypothetical protein BB559_001228 [Furculomyces boomerangus]|uniref:Phospholipid:diacylglycerol acyltransferase n=1 Tax=Furculomyces boomerangus TaxID=61424 RepID=A0A2T9Z2L8_9FUNG|nr:hypothetical protein BB559_001228 [Furculomyces boomerangus]
MFLKIYFKFTNFDFFKTASSGPHNVDEHNTIASTSSFDNTNNKENQDIRKRITRMVTIQESDGSENKPLKNAKPRSSSVPNHTPFTVYKKIKRSASKIGSHKPVETYFSDSIIQKELLGKKGLKSKRRFWFLIGIILGICLPIIPVKQTAFSDKTFSEIHSYISSSINDMDFAQYSPQKLISEDTMTRLLSAIKFEQGDKKEIISEGMFEPARTLKKIEDLHPKYPVVMIPGIITSGLESWCTEGCFSSYFRKRVWGTMSMFKALLLDKNCWFKHMLLDEETGLDPPGIKLRVTKGLEAADYFMTGYWVWAKVIDNLSEIGYDNMLMHMASYDWRLTMDGLEKRDGYFTHLKAHIELSKKTTNQKSIVISHSMGSPVFSHFLKWVESPQGGGGGSSWVDEHIESWVNTAGAMLGTSKVMSGLLSGEAGELVQPVTGFLLEKYMSRSDRTRLFRNWGSVCSMIPKGGNLIWGNANSAPDDIEDPERSEYGSNGIFIRFVNKSSGEIDRNLTLEESISFLKESSHSNFIDRLEKNYNLGIFLSEKEFKDNADDHSTFSNPLTVQLPNAKNMKLYSIYGVGLAAERAYHYTKNINQDDKNPENITCLENGNEADSNNNITNGDLKKQSCKSYNGNETNGIKPVLKYIIDNQLSDEVTKVQTGVMYSTGDGTVNLVSLGLMGAKFWKTKLFNPHNVKIINREILNGPGTSFYPGFGDNVESSDHIGILGNHEFLKLILRIVSGNFTEEDKYYSRINEISERIKVDIE